MHEGDRDRPESGFAYGGRAKAAAQIGEAADALPDADKAVGLLPDLAEAHAGRAQDYEALGRTDDAIAEYKRALDLKLDNPSES